jgi:hypothetical protein
VNDERLEKMRGLAAEAGLKEMAAAIVELRYLRGLFHPEAIEQDLVAALRAAIDGRGPITEDKIGITVERIIGSLRRRASGP